MVAIPQMKGGIPRGLFCLLFLSVIFSFNPTFLSNGFLPQSDLLHNYLPGAVLLLASSHGPEFFGRRRPIQKVEAVLVQTTAPPPSARSSLNKGFA
jgi:hypothetical protein